MSGEKTALVDRDGPAVEAAARGLGGATLAVVADVTRADDVDRAVRAPHDRWGRLDVRPASEPGGPSAFGFCLSAAGARRRARRSSTRTP